MTVPRILRGSLERAAQRQPVVVLTGPRQSGKTTLCRTHFPNHIYTSLEAMDVREFARADPRRFLNELRGPCILDEVQRVPELLSYIQGVVDENRQPGRFVLTGSQNLLLLEAVTQSLAGRTAMLELLPFSHEELIPVGHAEPDPFSAVVRGGYPALLTQSDPSAWLADYTSAYLERDVRQVLGVGDLIAFQTFLKLVAGRAGQLLSLSNLGADAGISQPTARKWLSVLEATYVVWRLPAFHSNHNKRLVKTPKVYFYDTGILCYLLGIRHRADLLQHPLRGAVFENWVVTELAKWHRHRGLIPRMSFYRDRAGLEVDVLIESGSAMKAIEVKSGSTVGTDFFDSLVKWSPQRPDAERFLIYAGESRARRTQAEVVSWSMLQDISWA